jgi:hypothetical protein
MAYELSDVSLPVFRQMLGGVLGVLDKAEAYATEKRYEPAALLQARFFPNMYHFARQIQALCDWPAVAVKNLTGATPPAFGEADKSFADLKARVEKTLAFVNAADIAAYNAAATRDIDLSQGSTKRIMTGKDYVIHRVLPQFYFHVTTAYDLLRHNGLDLVKGDYMGNVPGQRTA